jgi:hypothetical protein
LEIAVNARQIALLWIGAALSCGGVSAGPLVYERFENSAVGTVEGQVGFTADVVGYGGLEVENRRAAAFDGKPGTCVSYGTATQVASTDFTVEAFVKLARRPSYDAIAADWSEDGDNRSWAFVLLAGGGLRFDVSPDGAFHPGNKLETPARLIEPGKWYHVAAVSQGAVSRIYVNGRQVAATTRAEPGIFTRDTANLKIGNVDRYATEGPRPLHGSLDEVRITERALRPGDFLKTREPMPEVSGPVPQAYEMPFTATTKEEAQAWQARARAKLFELVEKQQPRFSTEDVPLDFQFGEPQDKEAYTLYKARFPRCCASTGTAALRRPFSIRRASTTGSPTVSRGAATSCWLHRFPIATTAR